jgi:hypothetical protein
MKTLKNIFAGFLVSFLGSIPLGYLNIVGYQIYSRSDAVALVWYLIGVIAVEAVIIYPTVIFADVLSKNIKLLKFIEIFSIVFMLLLATIFYFSSNAEAPAIDFSQYTNHAPFVTGVILSALNFIQIPFWLGWNLYLIEGGYISVAKNLKYSYIIATLVGTFLGMLVLILFLDYVTGNLMFISKYLFRFIIPSIFFGMAIYQSLRFYRKHRKSPEVKR